MKHRIEPLIAERAPWLASGRVPRFRAVLDQVLRLPETVDLAETLRDMPADRLMRVLAARIACNVSVSGLDHIPRHGPALIVANHPTGIADGIILHHLLSPLRPDLFFFANADVLRVLPQLSPMIAPVEWRADKRSHSRTRGTVAFTNQAMRDGRLGIIFPSGRLAKRRGLSLHEREWMPSAALLARRHGVPVIPIHICARNSALFYLLDKIHPTLRDITLFHEVLNKSEQPFRLRVGRGISAAALPANPEAAIAELRSATLGLSGPRRAAVGLVEATRAPRWLEPLTS